MGYEYGIYSDVEIVGQGFAESARKKTPGFYLKILPGQWERTVTWWLPQDKQKLEAALQRMARDLERMGLDLSRLNRWSQLDPASPEHVSFVGCRVEAECVPKDNEETGKTYEQWQARYVPQPVKALEPESVKQLDRMFGHVLRDRKPAAAAAVMSPSSGPINSPENIAAAGDEIPFGILFALPLLGVLGNLFC